MTQSLQQPPCDGQRSELSLDHVKEWLNSCVTRELIDLNIESLQGDIVYERLLYGLDNSQRRNDGRLRDNWLNKYRHLSHGGWWCNGLDILSGEESQWGCFKPDTPRLDPIKGKPIKYEHPPKVSTELFCLKVPRNIWEKVSERFCIEMNGSNFWEWVKKNANLPILITEGAKKAGALLSAGYVAIALPGVNSGMRGDGENKELIPHLAAFCQRWREFCFVFDRDLKYSTKQNVSKSLNSMGELLKEHTSDVSLILWDDEVKGVDDLIASRGGSYLDTLFDTRLSFHDWQESNKAKSKFLDANALLDFLKGELLQRLKFDELKSQVLLDGNLIELTEDLRFHFVEKYGYRMGKADLVDCLSYMAKKNSFNPVQDYLDLVEKEAYRIPIDNLALRYFGQDDPIYNLIVKRWLISAVARAYKPGCQADCALILQSDRQGIGKTTFFRVLGGEWYDSSVTDISKNDTYLFIHSCWIQELAEIERITTKKEAGEIKTWMDRTKDTFRKPYGREANEYPRRCVFCGTVNKSSFLVDETGNRRFWVVPISDEIEKINTDRLAKERDGIWASAIDAYRQGERWWMETEEERAIAQMNTLFEMTDEWESEIETYLENKDIAIVSEILDKHFCIPPAEQDRKTQWRVIGILTKLGWKKGGRAYIEKKRQQVWKKNNESKVLKTDCPIVPLSQKESRQGFETGQSLGQSQVSEKKIVPLQSQAQQEKGQSDQWDNLVSRVSVHQEKDSDRVSAINPPRNSALSIGDRVFYQGGDNSIDSMCRKASCLEIVEIKGDDAIVTSPNWAVQNSFNLKDLRKA